MSAFVNVASPDQPVYIDAEKVTALCHFPHDNALKIYGTDGVMSTVPARGGRISSGDVARKVSDAGFPLVALPCRGAAGGEMTVYIAPAHVTFATISCADKSGQRGIVAGVLGAGRFESFGITSDELKAITAATNASGISFLSFSADVARSRWHDAQVLYINPELVTRLEDDGRSHVNLVFAGGDTLDVTVGTGRMGPRGGNSGGLLDLNRAFDDNACNTQRRRFARDLAESCGRMIEVAGEASALYFRESDVSSLAYESADNHAYGLSVAFGAHSHRIGFSTPDERDTALKRVFGQQILASKFAAKSSGANPSSK